MELISKARSLLAAGIVAGFVSSSASAAIVFSDDMSSGAAWTVNATGDGSATFGYDYSADGIPSAPNGSGTLGLKMGANLTLGAVDEVLATPTGLSMTGNHRLTFDAWANFDLSEGSGTEFHGGGLGYDGISATRNGGMLLSTGDGGSSRDWRGYKNTGEQFIASLQYDGPSQNASDGYYTGTFPGGLSAPAAQSNPGTTDVGDVAFSWHTWVFTAVNGGGTNTISVEVDGLPIITIDANNGGTVNATTGNVALYYGDLFSSLAGGGDSLQFAIFDNVVVEDVPEPATFALLALGGVAVLRRRR